MDDVKKELELDCEPERAWRAISEPAELSEWLGGEVDVELRPGGPLTVTGEDLERSGFVEEVDEGRSLTFWWSGTSEEATRVELEVVEAVSGEGCVVRVTETRPLSDLEEELADITALALA